MRNKRLIIIFSCLVAVTLLVLLSSVVFTVRSTNTRCLNHAFSDDALDQKIIANTGIPKGKSIFFINEDEVIANIEKAVPDVKVINIERKFPDRVTVHYVKLFDYYEVASGGFYYSLTHEGRVISKQDAPKSPEQKIRVVYKSAALPKEGGYIYDGIKKQILSGIVSAFERLDLQSEKATARFDFVDIETETDSIYIGLSGINNLIKIEDASDLSTLFGKIQLGFSVVIAPEFDRTMATEGKYAGRYRMAYVISPTSAMNPYSDYDA